VNRRRDDHVGILVQGLAERHRWPILRIGDADSLDSRSRDRQSDASRKICAIFFGAQAGVPNTDFVRRKCRRECCREAVHAITDQDLRTAEVTISRAFL
jgi:hypothetical protein